MRVALWKPRQKALSVRAPSARRAPRGEALTAGRHAALPRVQQPAFSCTPASSGQTTPPAEGRLGDHAVGRQPRIPRPGSLEFSRAPGRRSRVFCKGAHPGKLVNASLKVREFYGSRVLRFSVCQGRARVSTCVALAAARPTAVVRGAKCTDSAPGGGSAAVGPGPRSRAEAGCPTRTERTLTGLVRGNATRRRLVAAVHISRFWRSGGFWRLGIGTFCCSASGWRGRESAGFRIRWRRGALESRRTPPGDTWRFAFWVPRAGADLGRSAAGVLGSRPRTVLKFCQYPRSDLGATSRS